MIGSICSLSLQHSSTQRHSSVSFSIRSEQNVRNVSCTQQSHQSWMQTKASTNWQPSPWASHYWNTRGEMQQSAPTNIKLTCFLSLALISNKQKISQTATGDPTPSPGPFMPKPDAPKERPDGCFWKGSTCNLSLIKERERGVKFTPEGKSSPLMRGMKACASNNGHVFWQCDVARNVFLYDPERRFADCSAAMNSAKGRKNVLELRRSLGARRKTDQYSCSWAPPWLIKPSTKLQLDLCTPPAFISLIKTQQQ